MPYNICCFARITYAHQIKGGMEIHTRILSEELCKRGHRVTILTTSLEPMLEVVRNENGVEIHYLPVGAPGRYSKEFFSGSVRCFHRLQTARAFDIVWSESLGAIGYIKAVRQNNRIPVFTILQGSFAGSVATSFRAVRSLEKRRLISFGRSLPNMFAMYIAWQLPLIRQCTMVVCPSPQTAAEIRRETLLPKSKMFVSVNGIDVNKFRPDTGLRKEGRHTLGLDDNDFLILNVGRLTSDKGVHILLEAINHCRHHLSQPRLAVIGTGGELSNLQKLCEKLDIKDCVHFLGFIPNDQLPMYYNACDLFVCPTVRVESFGIVLAEAMACSKPVISSAIGGTQYVVEDQISGLLVPPGNKTVLAENILKIASNPTLATEIGIKARQRAVGRFSSDRMVKDTEIVINESIHRWQPGRG